MYDLSKAAPKARICIQELLHATGIPCNNHNNFVAKVFHSLDQGCDSSLAVLVVSGHKRVDFIDKEDAPLCLLDDFVGLQGRLAKIAPYQTASVNFYQMSFL